MSRGKQRLLGGPKLKEKKRKKGSPSTRRLKSASPRRGSWPREVPDVILRRTWCFHRSVASKANHRNHETAQSEKRICGKWNWRRERCREWAHCVSRNVTVREDREMLRT